MIRNSSRYVIRRDNLLLLDTRVYSRYNIFRLLDYKQKGLNFMQKTLQILLIRRFL
jgi:hypothetical protein